MLLISFYSQKTKEWSEVKISFTDWSRHIYLPSIEWDWDRADAFPYLGQVPSPRWAQEFHNHRNMVGRVIKSPVGGFPGGAVVENLPANAGDTGSSPGLGRSHMPRSNWAREPQLLSLRVWSLCSATREATTVRGPRTAMKSGPRLPQLERALARKLRPNTAIN